MTTPATLVRRPLRPLTFIGHIAAAMERAERSTRRADRPRCVAYLDDGRVCGLPASYVDFKLGGHVCLEHRPVRTKKEALCL